MAASMKKETIESTIDFKSPPKFKFTQGEKVLCFHGPLIYVAKCLQTRYNEKNKVSGSEYHIHYFGWNKSYDEWVPESRVLKFNDTNLQKQKDLHRVQKNERTLPMWRFVKHTKKNKKNKRKNVSGGRESLGDPDSRLSTLVNDKKKRKASTPGPKAAAANTQSSSQESASDVPNKKKARIDPAMETTRSFSGNSLEVLIRNLPKLTVVLEKYIP